MSDIVETDNQLASGIGFHPLLGIDDRALSKGLQRNDAYNNINAFTDVLRERDSMYYEDMPFHTIDTDPSNTITDSKNVDELRAILQDRIRNKEDRPVPAEESTKDSTKDSLAASTEYPRGWAGVAHDLKTWNTLPVQPGWSRIHYVLTRDGRLMWLILFVVMLMVIGYVIHICK